MYAYLQKKDVNIKLQIINRSITITRFKVRRLLLQLIREVKFRVS